MAVTVKGLKNGPFEISGGVKMLDHSGKEYADRGDPVLSLSLRPIEEQALLQWQPRDVGFKSEETAG